MHLYYYHRNVLLIKTLNHSTDVAFELKVNMLSTVEFLVDIYWNYVAPNSRACTAIYFGGKCSPTLPY